MKLRLFNIFLLFIFIIYNQKTFAQQNKKIDEKKIVEDQVRELIVEDTFTQGGINYTLYKGIVAKYGKDDLNHEETENRNNKQRLYNSENVPNYTNTFLLRKGMFKIYHKQNNIGRIIENNPNPHVNPHINPHANSHVNPHVNPHANHPHVNPTVDPHFRPQVRRIRTTEYKTAYNNSSKKFGVLTGNIVIKVNPYERPPTLDIPYKIVKEYQHMGLYLISIPKNIKVGKALEDLRKKVQRVDGMDIGFSSSVNVEILENFKKNK